MCVCVGVWVCVCQQAGGKVTVKAYPDRGARHVIIKVVDNGPGLTAKQLAQLGDVATLAQVRVCVCAALSLSVSLCARARSRASVHRVLRTRNPASKSTSHVYMCVSACVCVCVCVYVDRSTLASARRVV